MSANFANPVTPLSEQVRELEAKLQAALARAAKWRTLCDQAITDCNAAESRLAQARVEGARSALEKLCAEMMTRKSPHFRLGNNPSHVVPIEVLEFRDREYPAPAAGDNRSTPPSAPEPRIDLPVVEFADRDTPYVVITPADARRIVGMGATCERCVDDCAIPCRDASRLTPPTGAP